ncbi:hypothetical protein GGTG_08512 [Gaeumannomyces tritici R3-111a-1]|uniref:Secreted protein n=1 Tax=Gaeumannomyces tritici (strain R3-111a-1) TaxID=644352 RepID=J3P4S6_GAET3|nr:hypothetical protein GGTG_08512 [Gaeumannomyces tritici R3-111a-1]EJT74673.1 hypothetical protein GGTG_08512 [Gaeumannomyces tritici R3-111a-1]
MLLALGPAPPACLACVWQCFVVPAAPATATAITTPLPFFFFSSLNPLAHTQKEEKNPVITTTHSLPCRGASGEARGIGTRVGNGIGGQHKGKEAELSWNPSRVFRCTGPRLRKRKRKKEEGNKKKKRATKLVPDIRSLKRVPSP